MTNTTSEWECVVCGDKTGTDGTRPCRCEREAAKAAPASLAFRVR